MITKDLQIRTFFIVLLFGISGITMAQNMNNYIALNVQCWQNINMDFVAFSDNTPVKIVTGDQEYNILVGTEWTSYQQYVSDSTNMFVYGNLKGFNCSGNYENITGIDVSKNRNLKFLSCANNKISTLDLSQDTALTILECYNNPFTTGTLDDLFCSLPIKAGCSQGEIYLLNSVSDANYEEVIASNTQNAINKNWEILYYDSESYVPETTGNFECNNLPITQERYISIMVQSGQNIELNFASSVANTPVKIISGTQEYNISVGTAWTGFQNYTAENGTIIVYGNINKFDCSGNNEKITGLDLTQNAGLINVICSNNKISNLDLSLNMLLTELNCANNQLEKLDLSKDTALIDLIIYNNLFTTDNLDTLFCSLPDRTGFEKGYVYPLNNVSDVNYEDVLATNSENALTKNWQIKFNETQTDIPSTTGNYVCSIVVTGVTLTPTMDTVELNTTTQLTANQQPINATNTNIIWSSSNENIAIVDNNGLVTGIALGNAIITSTTEDGGFVANSAVCVINSMNIKNSEYLQNIKIYPNPLIDQLHIETVEKEINVKIYNLQGKLMLEAKNNKNVSVSHMPAGIYILKIITNKHIYSQKIIKE
ncbi:MAG: T9SS type A sorting domain-containing protein [Bacteroidales bacterium]|nr:T9SS type A sorting domain-containing protein [Bacteroidales bacterium]